MVCHLLRVPPKTALGTIESVILMSVMAICFNEFSEH